MRFLNTFRFEQIQNDVIEFKFPSFEYHELNNKSKANIEIKSSISDSEHNELFLCSEFDEKDNCDSDGIARTKDDSLLAKDQTSHLNYSYERSLEVSTPKSYIKVPFSGNTPDLNVLAAKIKEEMKVKGINEVICETLEIKSEDIFFESPQLIRVKKRKTKEQIKELEREFALSDDWSKEFMNELAVTLKLDPSQVYKWHWDQICKKLGQAPKKKVKQQMRASLNVNKKTGNKRRGTSSDFVDSKRSKYEE